MRVYHSLNPLYWHAPWPVVLHSACGHLGIKHLIQHDDMQRNGLMFYMQAHETKLQTIIKTILQKDA